MKTTLKKSKVITLFTATVQKENNLISLSSLVGGGGEL